MTVSATARRWLVRLVSERLSRQSSPNSHASSLTKWTQLVDLAHPGKDRGAVDDMSASCKEIHPTGPSDANPSEICGFGESRGCHQLSSGILGAMSPESSPKRQRRWGTMAWLSVAAVILTVIKLRRQASPERPAESTANRAENRVFPQVATAAATSAEEPVGRAFWPVLVALPVTATAVGSLWVSGPLVSALLATIALIASALALRGPQLILRRWVAVVHVGCLLVAVGVVSYLVVRGALRFVEDIGTLLVLMVAAIAVVGVVAWLASSWRWGGRMLEPAALALVASILVAISLPGIVTFGAPLDTRQADGFIWVFTADPSLEVTLQIVVADPVETDLDSTKLWFQVTTAERGRWALLLEGDALLHTEDFLYGDTTLQDFSYYGEQLVSGVGTSSFIGHTSTSLARASSSRSAFRFPMVRKGVGGGFLQDVWRTALDTAEPSVPARLDVSFDAGLVGPDWAITQVSPPPEPDRYRLIWRSQDDLLLPIFLVQFDQQTEDLARNGFFGIAILLGTAGACLLAAMQVLIRPVAGRTQRNFPRQRREHQG
jgi:hypothetical protein